MNISKYYCKCGNSNTPTYYKWMTNCNCLYYYVVYDNNAFNWLMIRLSENKILLVKENNNKLEINIGNFNQYFEPIDSPLFIMENNFSSMEDLIEYFIKYSENLEFM